MTTRSIGSKTRLLTRRIDRAGVLTLAVCLGGWLAGMSPLSAADDLERQLAKHAPEVLAKLAEKGVKNVGILKFRIKKGDTAPTDRAGTLNIRLAEMLELALIVADKEAAPIGIVHDASRTAATIPGASHLSPEGRRKLFEKPYPLAWGDQKVVPDAFIVGVAQIAADRRTMQMGLTTFDREGKELSDLVRFPVQLDYDDLLESGESFSLRGVFDKGSIQLAAAERKDKATEEALGQTAGSTPAGPHPLSPTGKSPISLEIRYDGRPQPLEFKEGAAFVAEPQEHQQVSFVVRRRGEGRPRLGVVLKVNGENTLYRQKQADARCAMWIFEPQLAEFGVTGFQVDGGTAQAFRVLSPQGSKAREIDYGEFVGTIAVTVFPERAGSPSAAPQPTPSPAPGTEDFAILTRGVFPKETAPNLSALKHRLAESSTRGLIVEGAAVDRSIKTTAFNADPVPVMTATIAYYRPQDLPR